MITASTFLESDHYLVLYLYIDVMDTLRSKPIDLLRCGGSSARFEAPPLQQPPRVVEWVKSGTLWYRKDLTGASVQGLMSTVYSINRKHDQKGLNTCG